MDTGQARSILDVAHSAFISIDADGRIVYWNPRAEEIFGLTREQAAGRALAETIIPERHRTAHYEGLERFKRTGRGRVVGRRVELTALRPDGSEFPVELAISALPEGETWSFHAFILDISARRAAEAERQRLLRELELALHGTEQRLSVIVNALAEAVTIRGADDHIVYANQAALKRMKIESVEQLREADPRTLMEGFEAVGEDGQEIRIEDLPSMRVLRGEDAEPLMMRSVDLDSGEEQWVLLKAAPVRGPDGAVEAAVTIIEDVTVAKRAALRMEFLATAGQVLASSLDYEETLRNVAGLAVPQIADWCAVDLLDPARGREPVAVAHTDPAKLDMATRLRAVEPELDPEQGLGLVLRTGEPVLYNDIPDALLEQAAVDAEHLRLLRAVGMRAALIVPMRVGGRTIGALSFISAESGRTFDRGDIEFAEQIGERAALAVENARLYRARTEVARTLQNGLLPEALPHIPGWEIATMYRPAGDEGEVGGDFYDFWQVGSDWLMIIGDITGKGVAAATVTSLVRHTAWEASEVDARPARILQRVDAALKRRPSLPVCTALCLRVREGRGTVASGGHPRLLQLGGEGVVEVGQHGTLLGGFPTVRWPESPVELRPGDTIVGITDGVTDTVGAGEERFGIERLKEILHDVQNESPTEIRRTLFDALEGFRVGPQADDTAAVIMRFAGGPSGEPDAAGQTQSAETRR